MEKETVLTQLMQYLLDHKYSMTNPVLYSHIASLLPLEEQQIKDAYHEGFRIHAIHTYDADGNNIYVEDKYRDCNFDHYIKDLTI